MPFNFLSVMFVGEIKNSSGQEPEFSEKEDDEWILVDFSPTNHPPVFSCLPTSLECLADTSESCFVQFGACPMEERWFITPPPGFTAGGLTTIKVETSPLENLLIAHPSMSLYHSSRNLNEAGCETDEFRNPSSPRLDVPNDAGQHVHCCVAALAAPSTLLEQTRSFRPARWMKEHSERHSLNRNGLRRQNLSRDRRSRQIRHHGRVVHQPGQRQYKY
uniref:Tumor protein p53 inducible nuclear protein 1 n=1 Tax=Monodelphis domestica TaxID=13616 RepID=A0A5F8GCA7_MONDO